MKKVEDIKKKESETRSGEKAKTGEKVGISDLKPRNRHNSSL